MPSSAIAAKTRERLLDVARQLFASNGVERTTMNDIAAASDKGRRTIYTYFKNKKEIYDAVVEREAESIVARFRDIVESDMPARDKLLRYLEVRFDIVDETIRSSSSVSSWLLSFLSLDHVRLERIRVLAVEKERHLFNRLIAEGIASGDFDEVRASSLPAVYQMVFKGVDFTHAHDNFAELGLTPEAIRRDVIALMCSHVSPLPPAQ